MTATNVQFESSRLVLRPFESGDAESLFLLNSDPKVLRYTGDTPFPDLKAASQFIEGYDHYQKHGFGRWAVCRRDNHEFIGFCGLHHDADTAEVDLGFRLFPQFWAQGYATEAAGVALKAGFTHFQLSEIVGRAMRENLPSITVLQKLGMTFRELRERHDLFWLIYTMDINTFKRLNSGKS